ncbi:amy, partial [Symbiodinium microadriaticum]
MRVDAQVQANLALLPPKERVRAVAAALEGHLDEAEEPEEEEEEAVEEVEVASAHSREKDVSEHEAKAPKVVLLGKDAQELRVVQAQAFMQMQEWESAFQVWRQNAAFSCHHCPPFDEALVVYAMQAALCKAESSNLAGADNIDYVRLAVEAHCRAFGVNNFAWRYAKEVEESRVSSETKNLFWSAARREAPRIRPFAEAVRDWCFKPDEELSGQTKVLRSIDDRLTTTQALVPKALGKMKCEIPGHEGDIKAAMDKLMEDSVEQVGTIIDRLHDSANEAMAFNDLMHRQFEYKGNRLPEEVSEFSGTVVSNLHRAEDMAKKEMVAGAKDLVRMAEEVRTMIMASTMPASMCILGAPPIQRRSANAASQAVLERRTRRPWGEAEMPAAWRDEAVREARLLEKEAAAQPPQPQVEDSGPDFVTVVAGTVALFGLLLAGIITLSPPSPGPLPPVFDQPPSEALGCKWFADLLPEIMKTRSEALPTACAVFRGIRAVPCCGGLRRSVSGGDERDDEVEISTTITESLIHPDLLTSNGGADVSEIVASAEVHVRESVQKAPAPEPSSDFALLENEDGNCLMAVDAPMNGIRPTMAICDEDNFLQKWAYDETTGLIRHTGGKCLDASVREAPGGLVHLWSCDSSNENQMWEWDSGNTGRVKNKYGICLDAPRPQDVGSGVHMWTCKKAITNQRWRFVPAGTENFTTAAPSSTSTASGSPEETTSTTAGPTTTTTTTPEPLSAFRNCQLEPLVEGSGCKLLEVAEGTEYDLGENGQETAGRHACLKKLRNVSEADTLVHSLGRCELWHCSTLARVRMSSGPGGGLSESPYAVTFKTANGHYITAEEDGAMKAEEETFVPEALFLLMPAENGKFVLKAQNDRFVKAEPSGHLAAVTEAWDDWEEFELVKHESGKVSLRSFHNKYVSEGSGGSVAADAASATMLELANRSRHDGFENLQFHKTVSDEVSHSVCARPAEQAAVRCCSSDGSVASEDQYGCHDRKNYSEAEAICKAQSLELCTEVQAKSCPGCSTCGFETKQLWTSTACEGTEGLTQRRLSQRNDHAAVVSRFCGYQPGKGGLHGEEVRSTVFVKLMEWNYNDIAKECVEYLAPNGFDAVQVAPVTEHVLGYQWWVKYQPVSAGLDTRSGTEAEFRAMVATCRSVGVQVIVDILMNHMASPCKAARKLKKKANWSEEEDMPCVGWGGSRYGNRLQKGARGWDAANPKHFHHKKEDTTQPQCKVGPQTGWLCPDDDCTPCDMYALPDYATELKEVREMQAKHLEELFHIGVTALRVDAAIYHHVYELADMLNGLPWDLVYQEWWGEYPPHDRTEYVGLYRDVAYRWHLVNRLAGKNATDLPELLDLDGGVFGITQDMAVYPFAYHDGRSKNADPEIATYKNG